MERRHYEFSECQRFPSLKFPSEFDNAPLLQLRARTIGEVISTRKRFSRQIGAATRAFGIKQNRLTLWHDRGRPWSAYRLFPLRSPAIYRFDGTGFYSLIFLVTPVKQFLVNKRRKTTLNNKRKRNISKPYSLFVTQAFDFN